MNKKPHGNTGKKRSKETKSKLSEISKELWKNKEYRKKSIENRKKTLKKRPESIKKMIAHIQNPQVQEKISNSVKKLWNDPEYRKKQSETRKENWTKPDYRKKQMTERKRRFNDKEFQKSFRDACNIKPNKLELQFNKMFTQLEYTGDFSFFVGRKNPDFILPGSNLCIDIFGDYWHNDEEVEDRIQYFAYNGYELLIVWGDQIINNSKQIVEIVSDFIGVDNFDQ